MVSSRFSEWRKLPLSLTELCIDTTLRCGQSFRWRKINDEWHCVLRGRIVSLRQDQSHLHYRVTWPTKAGVPLTPPASVSSASPPPREGRGDGAEEDDTAALLHGYFALSHSLSSLYEQWAAADANFARRAPAFTGIRILNQDAWEALVAFICSSNNNISRISQMVHKLCIHYGPYVGTVEGEPFHDFPGPEALACSQVEGHLRQLGFGYRAKYIAETARIVTAERPRDWLFQLRNPDCPAFGVIPAGRGKKQDDNETATPPTASYRAAHEALLQLAGVGPKVADCVCLMGLGWGEAVPVDTHVWQIAQRDYSFGKGGSGARSKSKTFTKAMYDAVGDHFRKIWGPQAGWAQSVLFTANLRSFAEQASAARPESAVEAIATETTTVAEELAVRGKETSALDSHQHRESVVIETVSRTRKRKTTAAADLSVDSSKPPEAGGAEVTVRRTSKRRRVAAR